MDNLLFVPEYKVIPTQLTKMQFNQFVLPHLSQGFRQKSVQLLLKINR